MKFHLLFNSNIFYSIHISFIGSFEFHRLFDLSLTSHSYKFLTISTSKWSRIIYKMLIFISDQILIFICFEFRHCLTWIATFVWFEFQSAFHPNFDIHVISNSFVISFKYQSLFKSSIIRCLSRISILVWFCFQPSFSSDFNLALSKYWSLLYSYLIIICFDIVVPFERDFNLRLLKFQLALQSCFYPSWYLYYVWSGFHLKLTSNFSSRLL